MRTYKANKKGPMKYVLIGLIVLPVVVLFVGKNSILQNPIPISTMLAPLVLVSWLYFDTSYKIDEQFLYYRCAFLRGKIEIAGISEITKGKTLWSGLKPALARNGLIIKYNRYDEIYIAPENNDEIVNHLLRINSNIRILENR